MKMTIVIDTEDPNGLDDTHKMIKILRAKYSRSYGYPASNRAFGKIEFIKMIRRFAREAVDQHQNSEEFDLSKIHSLRYTKDYADRVWAEKE